MEYFLEKVERDLASAVAEQLGVPVDQVVIEQANQKFDADLAVPLFRFGSKEKSPPELASEVAQNLSHDAIEKAESASGFVNIWLKPKSVAEAVLADAQAAKEQGRSYGDNDLYKGQTAVVEFTDPNPFKELHIGHAYSNTVGESLARLMEAAGASAHRVTYGGDVGMHVAKAIWGIQKLSEQENVIFEELAEQDRAPFLGRAYARGAKAFEEDESAQAEIKALNKTIYEGSDETVNRIRELGREWSYDYFVSMYTRLGVTFERHFMESEATPKGVEMVKAGLEKGVFEQSDGATVFRGEEHGLHTRVFLNNEGLPTYEAKDLGLMFLKEDEFHYDRSVILTGNEQAEYFKVMLKAASMIQPELTEKTTHLSHGILKLSTGKMSSRTGDVVTAKQLLDTVEETVRTQNPDAPAVVENALGAFKYAMLKHTVGTDIVYDVEDSLDITGNSGPYVQYAAVRVGSILEKVGESSGETRDYDWQAERKLLALLMHYPEIVQTATTQYEPHGICNFAYELAREMNRYYETTPVKDASETEKAARVQLLSFMREVFEHSLGLLNISVPAKM